MIRTTVLAGASILISLAQPAWASGPASGNAPQLAATVQTRATATALVDVSGDRENFAKGLAPLESLLSRMIVSTVVPKDAAASAKVVTIVHERLSPATDKVVD